MILEKQDIIKALGDFSLELTPKGFAKIKNPLNSYLPQNTKIFITHLLGSDFKETVAAAKAVKAQGFEVINHFALRNFSSVKEIKEGLDLLKEAGIKKILLLGGGTAQQRHEFGDCQHFVISGILDNYEIKALGFAGHPEGNPATKLLHDRTSLIFKKTYALSTPNKDFFFASQFCFQSQPVISWVNQEFGDNYPSIDLRIGLAGICNITSLIKHAQQCGVGASLGFLRKNAPAVVKLFGGLVSPNKLLYELTLAQKTGQLKRNIKFHFFPLGGFEKTALWINKIIKGDFDIEEWGVNTN